MRAWNMIPKSGHRFSEKIMLKTTAGSRARRSHGTTGATTPMRMSPEPAPDQASATTGRRTVIDVRDVSLTFETSDVDVTALSHVNLQIGDGDFVSFIGPSGCGKTTLLRLIADLEQPTSGTVLVNGVSPEAARRARQYGYIFQ